MLSAYGKKTWPMLVMMISTIGNPSRTTYISGGIWVSMLRGRLHQNGKIHTRWKNTDWIDVWNFMNHISDHHLYMINYTNWMERCWVAGASRTNVMVMCWRNYYMKKSVQRNRQKKLNKKNRLEKIRRTNRMFLFIHQKRFLYMYWKQFFVYTPKDKKLKNILLGIPLFIQNTL